MSNRELPEGMIFTADDKALLNDICKTYNINLEYKISRRPYYRSFREYCVMTYYYESRFMSWLETRYIKAGRPDRKDRKFHFVLCTEAIVKNSHGDEYEKAPPESHKIRLFDDTTMIIVEMLNDDGIRLPHSLKKIKQYQKRLANLWTFAQRRIANQYGNIPYPRNTQLALFEEE